MVAGQLDMCLALFVSDYHLDEMMTLAEGDLSQVRAACLVLPASAGRGFSPQLVLYCIAF